MALKSNNKVSAAFNMSSMTDIVFLLLIFFMIASTKVSENGLEVSLPTSDKRLPNKPSISVSIDKNLRYAVDKQEVLFSDIEPLLRQKLAGSEKPSLALWVDKNVPTGETVKIMDIAARNKWKFVLKSAPQK